MINFLSETLTILKVFGKNENDIVFVCDREGSISWDEFKKLANVNYNNGYGAVVINTNLKIVGKDWWLERYEYDGSECWKLKQMPRKPPECFGVSIFEEY